LWNVAHVHAQLSSDFASKNAETPHVQHRDAAVALLRQALEQVPETERANFWKQFIMPDGLLNPLRGSPSFDRLARDYGR
jgi:hypothetical protein